VPRPIRLKLDSGATASVLYNPAKYQAPRLVRSGTRRGNGTNGEQRNLSGLPAQQVKIDSLELRAVPFFVLAAKGNDPANADFDGLLSTGLFRRVFISHAEHFAVLEAQ